MTRRSSEGCEYRNDGESGVFLLAIFGCGKHSQLSQRASANAFPDSWQHTLHSYCGLTEVRCNAMLTV